MHVRKTTLQLQEVRKRGNEILRETSTCVMVSVAWQHVH